VTDASEDCELHSEKFSRVAISDAILQQISTLDLDLCQCSLSLQGTSSKSEPLQAKDSMTSDPGQTRQGRLKFRKTGKPYCQSSTRCLNACGRSLPCGHHGEDEALVDYSEPAENDGNFRLF